MRLSKNKDSTFHLPAQRLLSSSPLLASTSKSKMLRLMSPRVRPVKTIKSTSAKLSAWTYQVLHERCRNDITALWINSEADTMTRRWSENSISFTRVLHSSSDFDDWRMDWRFVDSPDMHPAKHTKQRDIARYSQNVPSQQAYVIPVQTFLGKN